MEKRVIERTYGLKKYQIWIGFYHLGQGYDPPKGPKMIAEVVATDFRVACVLYELRSSLEQIERMIGEDRYIDYQSCRWFYDFDSNVNTWTGKYYETKKEAQQSFNRTR